MPQIQHSGLYFTHDQIAAARKDRDRVPLQAAWTWLQESVPTDPLSTLMVQSLRCRMQDDAAAGEAAVATLQSGIGFDLTAYGSYLEALQVSAALAHAFELVRPHPAWGDQQAHWLHHYTEFATQLNALPDGVGLVEQIWWGHLHLVSGVVLEVPERIEAGAQVYRQVIDQEVRPQGHLPVLVEAADAETLQRSFAAVSGLVLMAEAAAHVGVDLWSHHQRGITVVTAAAYLAYYYFYPGQWRWGVLDEAAIKGLYQSQGAFFEIVNRHTRLRDSGIMLDELRPFFNPVLGGLTTLTHALPARKGFFR
jgi:hypothetical protein